MIPNIFLGIVIAFFTAILIFILLLIIFMRRKNQQSRFLVFDTDDSARIESHNIKGKDSVTINKKRFNLKKAEPKLLRTKWGNLPFYLLHHRYAQPLKIEEKKISTDDISPETIESVINMSVLDTFLNMTGLKKKKFEIFQIILGAVIGALVILVGHYAGALPAL